MLERYSSSGVEGDSCWDGDRTLLYRSIVTINLESSMSRVYLRESRRNLSDCLLDLDSLLLDPRVYTFTLTWLAGQWGIFYDHPSRH